MKDKIALHCLKKKSIGEKIVCSKDLEMYAPKEEVEKIMQGFGFANYKSLENTLYRLEEKPMGSVADCILDLGNENAEEEYAKI